VNVLDVDCAVVSNVPSLMTENGRLATVVLASAARMSSTSVAALLSDAVDFACTSSSLNGA